MFFKKTRTKRLIKNRYTKSRRRQSTNRQLEVWDSSLLEWVFQILKDDAVKVLHSICHQIWKTQQWPQDWKRC